MNTFQNAFCHIVRRTVIRRRSQHPVRTCPRPMCGALGLPSFASTQLASFILQSANGAASLAEDLRKEERAELASSRGRYPGRVLQFLLGGPLGGAINVGAAVKFAARTPVLSWAIYKVLRALTLWPPCATHDSRVTHCKITKHIHIVLLIIAG